MNKIIFIDWGIFIHRPGFLWMDTIKRKLELMSDNEINYYTMKKENIPPTYTAMSMIISNLKRIGISPDDRIIVACDSHSWRKNIDNNYKKGRRKLLPEIYEEFNWLLDKIDKATNWNVILINSLEADDIMAVGARYFKDNEVILVTPDSDLEQMFSYKNVRIFSPIKKCAGKTGKGAYKIPPPNFNVYKLLSQKIRKETTDNLVNPILTQEDYDKRKQIVSLLELPETIENTIRERLSNLKNKDTNIDLLPFKNIRERFKTLYNLDKIITYEDSQKKYKKRKKK